ncbi:hypothetical protein [Synechococcus sp. PCC 7502]|uniref:hypothetical protein n=1 Tax=Synechococcus sp. PCC 7502 TaxID=1173263 RepID=UPI00030B4E19|nr:hypothetical protein [Synechococcus sp. PCC 7502]
MSQPICAIAGFGAGVSMGVARAFAKKGYSLAFCLAPKLKDFGIHVGTVTISDTVEVGTHFDPDAIAQSNLKLHQQAAEAFQVEVIYK